MKITILGCGSSGGVPLIGDNWGNCDPQDPRNRRTRVSILIEDQDTTVLVDTSPDMRQQLLTHGLKKLDAVLYTHAHADHCHGIDELRSVNWLTQKPIDVYADPPTLNQLRTRFPYIFKQADEGNFYKPSVMAHEINGPFTVDDLKVIPFFQNHGSIRTLGFRFKDFAYSTDVNDLDSSAITALRGIKTWVVDCLRIEPHPSHAHLQQTLEWVADIKPERTFLTHMSQHLDYNKLIAILPAGVWPAYDGLVIEC